MWYIWSALFLFFSVSCQESVLVIDYGSPITPYIKKIVQQAHVHCILCQPDKVQLYLQTLKPKAIILSGGESHVNAPDAPRAPQDIFELGIPILGICYGQQLMCVQLGGTVEHGAHPEQGPTDLLIIDTCALTDQFWHIGDVVSVWMGHEDRLVILPDGFKTIAHTPGSPHAVIADDARKFYGVQFHPEASRCSWRELIEYFVLSIAQLKQDRSVIVEAVEVDETKMIRCGKLIGCCSSK